MNTTLDGKITLTKKERETLEQAPLLAAQIALHRPAIKISAETIKSECAKVLWAALH